MSGIGAFLTGVTKGMETRRRWDRQEKLDGWAEEDREMRKEDRAEAKVARAEEADWRKYQRGRVRQSDQREEEARRAAAAAYDATVNSFDGEAAAADPTQADPDAYADPQRPRLTLPSPTPDAPQPILAGAPGAPTAPNAPEVVSTAPRRSLPDSPVGRMDQPRLGTPPQQGVQPDIERPQANRFQQAVSQVGGANLTPRLAMEADRAEAAIASGMNPMTRQPLNAYEVQDLQNVVAAAEERLKMDAAQFKQPRAQAPEGPYPPTAGRDGGPMTDAQRSRATERRAVIAASRQPQQRGMDVPMQDVGPAVGGGNIAAARTAQNMNAQGRVAADQGAAMRTTPESTPATPARPRMLMAPQAESPEAPTGPAAPAPAATPAQIAASGDTMALDAAAEQSATAPVPPSVDDAVEASASKGRTISMRNAPAATVTRAAKNAQSDFMTRYGKVGAPKMVEYYLKAGEPAKAEAYQKFVDRADTKAAMKSWADAVFYASVGDDDKFLDGLSDAYNARGYFDDGYEAVRDKSGITRDGMGNVTGAKIVFRDKQTGQEFTQEMDSVQDLYQMGVHMLAPEQVFEHGWQRIQQAEARQAAIIDYTRKQAGKGTQSDEKRLTNAMKVLGENDINFTQLPLDEQLAQAWAFAQRYDAQGNLRSGLASQTAGQPASQQSGPREVPRY